jgi:prolyl-tRNA synthetase
MSNDEIASLSEEVYNLLSDNGIEVLYDDRDYRPGFKFKDADLVGIPIKIVIGKRTIKQGKIEIELRGSGEQLKVEKEELVSTIKNIIQEQTIKV